MVSFSSTFLSWQPRAREFVQLCFTCTGAFCSGWLFSQLGTPAPYLMGSLFGVWLLGGSIAPLRPWIGVPRWFQFPVFLGLGVLIGATFQPTLIHQAPKWLFSIGAMIGATLLATAMASCYLKKIRGYDWTLAILCALPGGQAEAIVISRELTEKDYVVALCHLTRVVAVFSFTPFMLAMVEGQEAVRTSNQALYSMPVIADLSAMSLLHFVLIAVSGYWLARLLRVPIPYLLGPLLLSAALHVAGVVHIERTREFVILAQFTIGGGVGARLARVPFLELATYLKDAVVITILILGSYCLMAVGLAWFSGSDMVKMLLAFVPGGLYEVTLLAFLFGYDVPFVAFHHAVRMLMILFSLPAMAKFLNRGQQK